MKRRIVSSLVVIVAMLAACEKTRTPQPKGSGTLSPAELALFKYLPKNAAVYFAGDYSKLQDFMKSGLGRLASMVTDKMSPALTALETCLATPRNMKSAMAINVANKSFDNRIVIDGLTIAEVAKCGQQAQIKTTVDPDGRYVSIEVPLTTGTFDFAYYAIADHTLYVHQTIVSGEKSLHTCTRTDCEADLAKLGHDSAADDADFNALASKADRSKTAWFVGAGAGTPLAEAITELYGSLDATSGIAIDVTVQMQRPGDAEKLERGVTQLRKMADQLPESFKAVVAALKFDRAGDRVHAALALTDAQVKSVSDQLGSMLGALH
ncbi:MAG TPA: hypothetical protein VGL61_26000 [Kofleriaceae bacterium]|jgi:hypothetical protein